jgi:hypothetical protein
MKRFLFFILSLTSLSINGQVATSTSPAVVVLNEMYTDPSSSTHEFLEFYNSSFRDIYMDDYTVLVYFENNTESGFYVIDLPNLPVSKNDFFVLASASPFNVQSNVPITPDVNWSSSSLLNDVPGDDSYIKKYVINSTNTGYNPPSPILQSELNDIIQKRRGSEGQYHVLIFDGTELVNFFVGGYSTLPSYVNNWPALTVPYFKFGVQASTKLFDFAALQTNDVEKVISVPGSNNGYRRTQDGQCGTWVKSSSGTEHTPGYSNGRTTTTGSLTVFTQLLQGPPGSNTLNLQYRIAGSTDPDVWPVTVKIINDYGVDISGPNYVNEGRLPESRLVPYNSQDEEEPASSSYPVQQINQNDFTFKTYTTSPIITLNAYEQGYVGSKQPRQFHVFYQAKSGCFDQVDYAEIAAIPLPVSFKSFTAKRNKQNVVLSWQTASEQNNAGFAIERNINGSWTEIAYVPSQANGGNSSTELSYMYNDMNNHKGISQYRIRQNDLDAKTSFSVVRSVQGEGAGPKLVIYPNPSFDGRVQLVFEDASSTRHIVISDMNGRIVRQVSNVLNSSMTVDGLNAGLYTARVINQATGESTIQKFVIQQK